VKLVRAGERGRETPAVMDDDGTLRSAAGVTSDYGHEFFASDGLERLRAAYGRGDLPVLPDPGRIGACISRPGKIVCVGLNYIDHAAEAGMTLPDEPLTFLKAPSSLSGPHDDLPLPIGGEKTDWEVEVGVVIGRTARYLPDEASALATIAGYCVSNDVSERHFQLERGGQWSKGKSAEGFNPLGPWLVTPDEDLDFDDLALELRVNGEVRQQSTTRSMVFSIARIIHYVSQFMVLEPGDLINTGTPPGTGMGLTPPVYLREGDVVETMIEGLGSQRQVCVRAVR